MPKIERYHKELEYSYTLGIFPSIEALERIPERCKCLLLAEELKGEGVDRLLSLCKENAIRVEYATKALQRIVDKKSTKVALLFQKDRESRLLSNAHHIVLYNIMDAGNLGTILRSALGFGFLNIAIIKPATDVYEPQTIRASMGALFQLCVQEFSDFQSYYQSFSDRDIYPFMLKASQSLEENAELFKSRRRPCSLVFGNEGSGLPDFFADLGYPTRIIHSNKIDSLNLGNAVAIALYKFSEGSELEDGKFS